MTTRFLEGDWIEQLRTLDAQSVHCAICSPPYWGLRDYGHTGQLGLETDPNDYIRHLVDGFRELRRVLRKDGTLWVVIGDSFTDGGRGDDPQQGSTLQGSRRNQAESRKGITRARPFGLGSKQLILMPARFALAMQDDGWIVRMDNIWSKPNPMPESVRDRCTKSHEYIFHFASTARYYYDQHAIAEPISQGTVDRISQPNLASQHGSDRAHAGAKTNGRMKAVVRKSGNLARKTGAERGCPAGNRSNVAGSVPWEGDMRNKRSVWNVSTKPFKGAHYATYPADLIEPCIKAGTSEQGCCPSCGAQWKRVIEKTAAVAASSRGSRFDTGKTGAAERGGGRTQSGERHVSVPVGWTPGCDCPESAAPVPCVVLDPFGGSGTTGLAADRLGRDAILIEINPATVEMAKRRVRGDAPLFHQEKAQ